MRPLSRLTKNRRQGNPCQYARGCGRYAAVRFAAPSSQLISPARRASLVPPRTVAKATENEIYASGGFCLLSLSLSLSLSPREQTREKKIMSAQHSLLSKQKFTKPQFQVSFSSDFAFNMWKSNCALDEDSAGVTVVGLRTKFGIPALTGPLHRAYIA